MTKAKKEKLGLMIFNVGIGHMPKPKAEKYLKEVKKVLYVT